jgi:hypothetical protein
LKDGQQGAARAHLGLVVFAHDVGDFGTTAAAPGSGSAGAAHVGHAASTGLGTLADLSVGYVMAVADDHRYGSLAMIVDQGF